MIVILARLFYWQYFGRDSLLTLAQSQYLQNTVIPAARGEILTSDNFPLVTNQQSYLLYAIISKLKKSPKEIAQKLAPILYDSNKKSDQILSPEDLEKEIIKIESDLTNQLSQNQQFQVQLATKLTLQTKEQIDNLQLEGLFFEDNKKRFYPEASMAAHLLGFVGADKQGKDTGYFGLEGYFNDQLKGRDGFLKLEKDASGKPILVAPYQPIEPENGRTILTTIDRTAQLIVETELNLAIEKYGAKGGSVAVMNPQNGAIFAMASVPNYDPAMWQQYDSNFYKNPVVADTYEPGSTFKIVVVAAAINEGEVKSDTICDKCEGPRDIGGFTIKTWNNKYYPQSTMAQILEHSDNVGMVFVAEKLGLGRLYNYLQDFGFGKETKIDLQEEAQAGLRAKKDWKEIDLATASFGQGISITPIQMLRAAAVIASGGNLVQPHLVEKIIAGDRIYEQKQEIKKGVIKKETARIVAEMMFKAVENGEAKRLKPKDLKVAGKTGTAQIPLAGHYDPTKTIASFVGFAPVENPKFVMLVRIDQPSSSQFGSETAAPTFFNIAKELLTYWGISSE